MAIYVNLVVIILIIVIHVSREMISQYQTSSLCISKMQENIVAQQLSSYLHRNNVLKSLSCFMPHHRTDSVN